MHACANYSVATPSRRVCLGPHRRAGASASREVELPRRCEAAKCAAVPMAETVTEAGFEPVTWPARGGPVGHGHRGEQGAGGTVTRPGAARRRGLEDAGGAERGRPRQRTSWWHRPRARQRQRPGRHRHDRRAVGMPLTQGRLNAGAGRVGVTVSTASPTHLRSPRQRHGRVPHGGIDPRFMGGPESSGETDAPTQHHGPRQARRLGVVAQGRRADSAWQAGAVCRRVR